MITWRTPLHQVLWDPDIDMCQAMVDSALSIVDQTTFETKLPYAGIGLEAGNLVAREAFETLLGPGAWALDIPFRSWVDHKRVRTQGISTCAMVALGLLRRLGVDCEAIQDGYADDIGTGLDVAIRYAKNCNAWQTPVDGLRPEPGAIIQVASPMHVCVAIRWDGDELISADGGQVGRRGLQACAMRRRKFVGKDALGGRKVLGWIEPSLLGYSGSMTLPLMF